MVDGKTLKSINVQKDVEVQVHSCESGKHKYIER